MPGLPIGADQRQFTKWVFVLHKLGLAPGQQAHAGATRPQRLLGGGASLQHIVHQGVGQQMFQRLDGRVNNKKLARFVPRQRLLGPHPHRLKLLGLIGHRRLALGHAGDQKRHVKTAWQIAVGGPVGQYKNIVSRQRQAQRLALRDKRLGPVEPVNVALVSGRAVSAACQQHPEFFKTLADGGDRLRQMRLALGDSA